MACANTIGMSRLKKNDSIAGSKIGNIGGYLFKALQWEKNEGAQTSPQEIGDKLRWTQRDPILKALTRRSELMERGSI